MALIVLSYLTIRLYSEFAFMGKMDFVLITSYDTAITTHILI